MSALKGKGGRIKENAKSQTGNTMEKKKVDEIIKYWNHEIITNKIEKIHWWKQKERLKVKIKYKTEEIKWEMKIKTTKINNSFLINIFSLPLFSFFLF